MTYSTLELNKKGENDAMVDLPMPYIYYQSESDKEAIYTTLEKDQTKDAQQEGVGDKNAHNMQSLIHMGGEEVSATERPTTKVQA